MTSNFLLIAIVIYGRRRFFILPAVAQLGRASDLRLLTRAKGRCCRDLWLLKIRIFEALIPTQPIKLTETGLSSVQMSAVEKAAPENPTRGTLFFRDFLL